MSIQDFENVQLDLEKALVLIDKAIANQRQVLNADQREALVKAKNLIEPVEARLYRQVGSARDKAAKTIRDANAAKETTP